MVENQAYLFLVFSLIGVIIGILFDVFRVLRKSVKTPDLITYIEDVLFWILTGVLILFGIWYFNNGEIRLFMFLGIIMGILIYVLTLSDLLRNIILKFIDIIKKIVKIIEIPFRPIIKFCQKTYKIIRTFLIKITKNGKKLIKFKNKKGNLGENGE